MSLEIHMTKAGSGDCILLRIGKGEHKFNLLIDSGNTSNDFVETIKGVHRKKESIDYLVITHDDADHVKGLFTLLDNIKKNKKDDSYYKTIVRNLSSEQIMCNYGGKKGEITSSAEQMESISEAFLKDIDFQNLGYYFCDSEADGLRVVHIEWRYTEANLNNSINEMDEKELAGIINKTGDMEVFVENRHSISDCANQGEEFIDLIILSPDKNKLKSYIDEYWDEIRKSKQKEVTSADKNKDPNEEWTKSIQNHVDSIYQSDENSQDVDKAPCNNASISFLLVYEGECFLFAADANPNQMVSSGKKVLKEFSKTKKQEMDSIPLVLMKMPHHGGSYNVTKEFLKMYRTDHYLISTNGHLGNKHPGKRALARIALSDEQRKKVTVYGNYEWWSDTGKFGQKEAWMKKGTTCLLKLPENKGAFELDFRLLKKSKEYTDEDREVLGKNTVLSL